MTWGLLGLKMETPSEKTRAIGSKVLHLPYLDGLRGWLAVYVLCHHFIGWNTQGLGLWTRRFAALFQFGHSAVGFFIVLSGFSLMLPVAASADQTIRGGLKGYLFRRARRILPGYYAALVLSIFVLWMGFSADNSELARSSSLQLTWTAILSHLLLVHTWIRGQAGSINIALWSVATEWHIYFLFPLVLLPVLRRLGVSGLLLAAFGIGLAPQLLLSRSADYLKEACPWYVGLFAIGMAAALAVSSKSLFFAGKRWIWPVAALISVVFFLVLKIRSPGTNQGGPYSLQWLKDTLIGMAAAALLCFCAGDFQEGVEKARRSFPTRFLETRIARILGGFSYSLYATHCAIYNAMILIAARLRLSPLSTYEFCVFVGIPTALITAYFFSEWFEKPFISSSRAPALSAGENRLLAKRDRPLSMPVGRRPPGP